MSAGGPHPSGGDTGPLAILQRIAGAPERKVEGPRCELCGASIGDDHQHVVSVAARNLACTCRPCYLLFTAKGAALHYRAVPDRYLQFVDFRMAVGQWDDLEIPVGIAFFFRHSGIDKMVAFYPGPAGATESELPLSAWAGVTEANPGLDDLEPDVEALLIRVQPRRAGAFDCFLVPVDACYQLVGRLRQVWRGFDGGQEARHRVDGFFEDLTARCQPATAAASGVPA